MEMLILKEIERIAKMYPSQRFGQLVFNLYYTFAGGHARPNGFDYFHCDDEEFYNWLKGFKGFN